MPNGELSPTYYLSTVVDGKRIECSTGCKGELEARFHAQRFINELRQQVIAQAIGEENLPMRIGGKPIALHQIFSEYLTLKKKSVASLDNNEIQSLRIAWEDFSVFIKNKAPWVQYLTDITNEIAVEYIQYLRTHGKYSKSLTFRVAGSINSIRHIAQEHQQMSLTDCDKYHQLLTEILGVLIQNLGLLKNPFTAIAPLNHDEDSWQALTPEELDLIKQKAPPFLFPIIAISLYTGLSVEDVSTLKIDEIEFATGWLTHKQSATQTITKAPILPPLQVYIKQLAGQSTTEFLLPEQAKTQLKDNNIMAIAINQFFLTLQNSNVTPSRINKATAKDINSLRLTYCYMALAHEIPLAIVTSITGHVTSSIEYLYLHPKTAHCRKIVQMYLDNHLKLPAIHNSPMVQHRTKEDKMIMMLETMTPDNWSYIRDELLAILRTK